MFTAEITSSMKPLIVASTRPELIKLAPVMKELERNGIKYVFATTGQHYHANLFRNFVDDLGLKKPDYNIRVGSGTQGYQTAAALVALERIMEREKPDVVIVEGDTNSVLSGALSAVKLHIPVAHVEAGLRSFDRLMPEEINRVIADHCSEVLFAPTKKSAQNLRNEGISPEKIFVVGNTIVDATLQNLKVARKKCLTKFQANYLLLTLHRAENVDNADRLRRIVNALARINENIVFPIHPRTKKMLKKFKLLGKLQKKNIHMTEPLGYAEFLSLLHKAKAVLTDSGGIQEEAIVLSVPCITLRTTTERPETVEAGGNVVAGVETGDILKKIKLVLSNEKIYRKMKNARNPFGDGKAGRRIVKILLEKHERGELKISSPGLT